VTKDGNAFQTLAPATGKERSPIVVLRVGGTTSADEDAHKISAICNLWPQLQILWGGSADPL